MCFETDLCIQEHFKHNDASFVTIAYKLASIVVAKSKGMQLYQHETRLRYCSRQSNMSVVLAVIASYSRCFVRMLPVNWLLTSSSVSV